MLAERVLDAVLRVEVLLLFSEVCFLEASESDLI